MEVLLKPCSEMPENPEDPKQPKDPKDPKRSQTTQKIQKIPKIPKIPKSPKSPKGKIPKETQRVWETSSQNIKNRTTKSSSHLAPDSFPYTHSIAMEQSNLKYPRTVGVDFRKLDVRVVAIINPCIP